MRYIDVFHKDGTKARARVDDKYDDANVLSMFNTLFSGNAINGFIFPLNQKRGNKN